MEGFPESARPLQGAPVRGLRARELLEAGVRQPVGVGDPAPGEEKPSGEHCHQAGKKGGKCGRPLSWLSGATTDGSRWAQVLSPRAPSQGLEAGGGSSPPSRRRPRCGVSPAQRRLGIQATLAAEPRGRTTDTAATTRGHRKVAVAPGSASLGLSGLGPGPGGRSGLATEPEPEAEAEARPWANAVDLGSPGGVASGPATNRGSTQFPCGPPRGSQGHCTHSLGPRKPSAPWGHRPQTVGTVWRPGRPVRPSWVFPRNPATLGVKLGLFQQLPYGFLRAPGAPGGSSPAQSPPTLFH